MQRILRDMVDRENLEIQCACGLREIRRADY